MKKYVEQRFFAVQDEERGYITGCIDMLRAAKEHCPEDTHNQLLTEMYANIRKRYELPNKVFIIGEIEVTCKCEACGTEHKEIIYAIDMFDVESDGTIYDVSIDEDGRPYIEIPGSAGSEDDGTNEN